MSPTATDLANQEQLKLALQADRSASKLEQLAAAILGRLLGIPIAVAKSGFQHGGDAGAAGQQGRRFRLECKKYADTSNLSDREVLGEIDHALAHDEALEGWFLITTSNVREQLAQSLSQKGENIGVPVVIIDWKATEIAPLAALCAFAPDLVGTIFSTEAGTHAASLQSVAQDGIKALERNLQSWCLGFEILRTRSHDQLTRIWTSPRTSNAALGQDAAGGAQTKKVRREAVRKALSTWWQGAALADAPAAVVGWEGAGKTWATLDWLIEHKADHPIVLVAPSSAAASLTPSETGIKRFLAERLYELTGVRNPDHWMRRLDYLLKRPVTDGPVITVFFDGLNQESSVAWLPILKALQGDTFAGRVRVIASSRAHYFENKLSRLQGLVVPATLITVDLYDLTPGGELDQMLAFEGLSRGDLHAELVELARTPRLFKLVVHFRDRLIEGGKVTVHRLLWEYGRDTLGIRAGKSFSESEWQEWLREIARRYREGVEEFSLKTLAETASRPDLSEQEVYARLSDIIDGRFATPGPSGTLHLTPTVVTHALGVALLAHLAAGENASRDAIEEKAIQWLDSIAGLDQRAEILRAAISILVASSVVTTPAAASVLVTAWLQTQNIADAHRHELIVLAPQIPDALLDAVERSDPRAQASARLWAVNALRSIPRLEGPALATIVVRSRRWLSVVSRDLHLRGRSSDTDKHHAERYEKLIGIDASGPLTTLGVPLQLVDRDETDLQTALPSIIEGFPLAQLTPCFEVAVVAFAVRGHLDAWKGLKWLCHLNEVDPRETADALRALSRDIRTRVPESGVHRDLPAKAASLLLWLSGEEQDEQAAAETDPGLDQVWTYEKDYLANPSRSIFTPERRHADLVLNDQGVALAARIDSTKEFWLDPSFQPPQAFVEELRQAAEALDLGKVNREGSSTRQDRLFEALEPLLARCAPELLARIAREKLRQFATCPPKSRYWNAIRATDQLIVAGQPEAAAARTLRLSATDSNANEESFTATHLLMIELQGVDTVSQFAALIAANLKFVTTDFRYVLNVPTPQDVDELVGRYRNASEQQQHDLTLLLSIHPIKFSDETWDWLFEIARQRDHKQRGVVFRTLAQADAVRFGRLLAADGWSWSPGADLWVNHYGSGALVEAESALPFDQLAPRIAPWRLLEAARVRGADAAEVRLSAEIFGYVLRNDKLDEPDPGSDLSITRAAKNRIPFVISAEPRRPQDPGDLGSQLRALMDDDARIEARERAGETALARINEARAAGASLYLNDVDPEDIAPVIQHSPDLIEWWLEGYQSPTTEFRKRVRLAEAVYLSICEALLVRDPARGADLWRALNSAIVTHFIGPAGVEELRNVAFRAPDSPAVGQLRNELLTVTNSSTDLALFDLALAANYNGKAVWLTDAIEADRGSQLAWRQKRALILEGFMIGSTLPVEGAWPEGPLETDHAELRHQSAYNRLLEGCARHWWRMFLAAENAVDAYAAWVLFLRSADRRAWVWMRNDLESQNQKDAFFDLKIRHVQLNRWKLEQAMKRRQEKRDKKFLGHDLGYAIGPWGMVQRH